MLAESKLPVISFNANVNISTTVLANAKLANHCFESNPLSAYY